MNYQALVPTIVKLAQQWVESQRNKYRPTARGLIASEQTALGGFHSSETLRLARIAWGPVAEEPPWYPELQKLGLHYPFSEAAAVTYVDTIFFSERFGERDKPSPSTLFHELVHVVQFQVLGAERFLGHYVEGYLRGGQVYRANPLEAQAYALQDRYDRAPTMGFSVLAEVQRATY